MKTLRVKLYYYNNQKWNGNTKKMERVEPYLAECLGSDNWFKLDARLTKSNLIKQAKQKINRLRNVKSIDHFEIIQGYTNRISELDKKGKIIAKMDI